MNTPPPASIHIDHCNCQHSALSTQHSALSTQHSAPSTQHSALSVQRPAPRCQHSASSAQGSASSAQHPARATRGGGRGSSSHGSARGRQVGAGASTCRRPARRGLDRGWPSQHPPVQSGGRSPWGSGNPYWRSVPPATLTVGTSTRSHREQWPSLRVDGQRPTLPAPCPSEGPSTPHSPPLRPASFQWTQVAQVPSSPLPPHRAHGGPGRCSLPPSTT